MRINKIEISNVLGLARADIACPTPVVLIAGANGAGKSTIADAISLAILGKPRRVEHKKDLGQLLHNGEKKGRVTLLADGEVLGEFRLPKGEHLLADGVKGADFLPYVLTPSLFAGLSDADRRAALFKLTNCKVSPDKTEEMLLELGADPDKASAIKPALRAGFANASKEAAEQATQSKGAWKAVTGQQWGSDKAEGFAIEVPEGPAITTEMIDAVKSELAAISEQITKGTAWLAVQGEKKKQAAGTAERRNDLTAKAELLSRANTKKGVTEKELAGWEKKLAMYNAAYAAAELSANSCACPSCGVALKMAGNKLEIFTGEKSTDNKAELENEIAKAKEAVSLLRRTLQNDVSALTTATNAKADLAKLAVGETADWDQEAIERGQDAIVQFRKDEAALRAKIAAYQDRLDLIASADKDTAKAAGFHADVKAWLLISAALAPNGIPATILKSALAPVNDSLAVLAGMSGWALPVIGDDMAITFGDRAYGLLSESEKWRADTLFALSVAQISDLKLAVIDRFDVLDIPSRGQFLKLLCKLARIGSMDTIIICGTMKAAMSKPPKEVTAVWIENNIAESA